MSNSFRVFLRRAPRLAAHAALCLALLLGLSGCREKMVYKVGGTDLPDLADTPGVQRSSAPSSDGVTDSVTFSQAKLPLHEDYVAWLSKNGWSRLTENQEVTSVQTVMSKDGKRLILTFSPAGGLVISGTRPK